MKSEGETPSEVAPIARVVSIAAVGVSSASSIATIAKGLPLKVHANQETASAKAKCIPKRPRKLPELRPKEAMIAYRINLKKKLQEMSIADMKVKESENTNLKELIAKLQKEQAEMIKTVLTMKEDERNVLSTETEYTKVTRLRKQNWSEEKRHTEALQKLTESIDKADMDIKTGKQRIEDWTDYRDKGHLQHKQEIILLQKEMNNMEKYFEQRAAQLEQDCFRSHEEFDRITEETIEHNQRLATETAIHKMDRYDRKEIMENYWLREEIETQQQSIEKLLHETEELAEANLTLLNDTKCIHLEDLKTSRIAEQFSSVENLCENITMETDLLKLTQKKSAVFLDENETSSEATFPHLNAEVNFSRHDGKNVKDGGCEAEDEKDDKYLKQGPLELQLLKISGHLLNIQQLQASVAEEVKALDNSSCDQWPVTRNMLKKFCKNSYRH